MPPLTEAQREYQRRYSRANRERIAEKNRRYRQENREKLLQHDRERYEERYADLKARIAANPELRAKRTESVRAWRARNPDKQRAITKRWQKNNPGYRSPFSLDRERANQAWRAMYERNAEREKTRASNKRAKKAAIPGTHTEEEWLAVVRSFGGRCAYCGADDKPLTRDHAVPVSRRRLKPTNGIENIVPACGPCNFSKKTKTPKEFRTWLKKREQKKQLSLGLR